MREQKGYIEMKAILPYVKGIRISRQTRPLILERSYLSEGEKLFDVNITIEWNENDSRYEKILSGEFMVQNRYTDCRAILSSLQELFPELQITYRKKP